MSFFLEGRFLFQGEMIVQGSRFITWFLLGKFGKVLWFFDLDFIHTCTEVAYGAYIPTLTAPFIGNAPGVWEDLRPPNRSCWRLINDDYTSGGIRDDGGWCWMMGMMGDDGGWKMEREEQQKQIPKRERKRLGRQNGKGSQGMRTFLVHLFVHFVLKVFWYNGFLYNSLDTWIQSLRARLRKTRQQSPITSAVGWSNGTPLAGGETPVCYIPPEALYNHIFGWWWWARDVQSPRQNAWYVGSRLPFSVSVSQDP